MAYEKKISVIVPVYNAKQYIQGCVKSVLKQTHTDFELILIDDGSEDGSKEFCEKLCTADRRIRFICQKHGGASSARNTGINAAKGKYLFFLDSDDIIHPQLLEALYKLQEKNHTAIASVDFYYAQRGKFRKPKGWKIEKQYMKKGFYLASAKARDPVLFAHSKTRLNTIGGKMILCESVKGVRFDEELTHGEDTRFLYQLIYDGADVSVLQRKWYYYRKTESGSSMAYSAESCRSRYKVHRHICDCAIKDGKVSEAVYAEWLLLCELILWREMGRKNQDFELEKYAETIIKTEKKREIFSKIDWCRKIIFYLGCVYYPLYKVIADIVSWYHENLDIPSEFRHNGQYTGQTKFNNH